MSKVSTNVCAKMGSILLDLMITCIVRVGKCLYSKMAILSEEDHRLEHASSVQGCIVLLTNGSNNMQIHVFI